MQADSSTYQDQARLNVLLIEDDKADAEYIRTLLSGNQSQVSGMGEIGITHATYFNDGLDVLASQPIDLVLLDLHLPDGEGADLVRRLTARVPQTPIVVLTGMDTADATSEQLIRDGAQDYLRKNSLDHRGLVRCLNYALSRHAHTSALQARSEALEGSQVALQTAAGVTARDLKNPLKDVREVTAQLEKSLQEVAGVLKSSVNSLPEDKRAYLSTHVGRRIPVALDTLRESWNTLDNLTTEILAFASPEQTSAGRVLIDVNTLVSEVIAQYRENCRSARISIRVSQLHDVTAHRPSLRQIFSHIIDNAFRYLNPARPGHIHISSSRDAEATTYRIADNGMGITVTDQPRVFRPFQRGSAAGDTRGDGMGMPLAQSLVEQHGGHLWFDSAENEGCVFQFSIPHASPSKDLV